MYTFDQLDAACPFTLAYVSPSISDHQLVLGVHTSAVVYHHSPTHSHPIAVICATEFSEYGGTEIERSNHRTLLAEFPGLFWLYGPLGYQALAYDASLGPVPEWPALADRLADLETYAAVDDEDVDAMQAELVWEAWLDHGAQAFATALEFAQAGWGVPAAPIPLDTEPSDDLRTALWNATHRSHVQLDLETMPRALLALWQIGCYEHDLDDGTVEPGGGVHFALAPWIVAAGRDPALRTLVALCAG